MEGPDRDVVAGVLAARSTLSGVASELRRRDDALPDLVEAMLRALDDQLAGVARRAAMRS